MNDDQTLPAGPLLVFGLGVTGRAVTAALSLRGRAVIAADDSPSEVAQTLLGELGVELATGDVEVLVGRATGLVPTPGLPDAHPVLAAARAAGLPVLSEFDLAHSWDERPLVAITGTNGKTTVTTLVTEMLQESGLAAVAAGNTDVPLVAAIDDPMIDVFVVEASSFRLGHSRHFAPDVGVWLNFAPDHLDVHADLAAYESAKARIWRQQGPEQLAVANAADPVVARHATGPARVVNFGGADDFHEVDGVLVTPDGVRILAVDELRRALPHDVANALAASAAALGAGATLEGVREALAGFEGLAHRVSLVGEADGIRWFDDSKATTPHAIAAAVRGFPSVVLIAGGRNKGLDLAVIAELVPPVRAVVGIGEAGPEIVEALAGIPSSLASSMDDAVIAARRLANPGDVVVLSPGCASFDWYRNYGERGDDFTRAVHEKVL